MIIRLRPNIMKKYTKKELIKLRAEFMPYEKAEAIQKLLISIYALEYKPKHSKAEYCDLILDNKVGSVEERHEQDTNYPEYVYEVFSVVSQRVYGFTKEHCLDQIWDAVEDKKKRIAYYKTLPTLEELVNSGTEIDPEEMYSTKEDGEYEDSCAGRSGDIILRMRKIGIDEYYKEAWIKEWEMFFSDIDWRAFKSVITKFIKS